MPVLKISLIATIKDKNKIKKNRHGMKNNMLTKKRKKLQEKNMYLKKRNRKSSMKNNINIENPNS
jgi:hypothetical protein